MPVKRGKSISLAAGSLRTCPECRKPRGTVRGEFVGHVDGNGQHCPGSGRPAASRSGMEGALPFNFRFPSRKDGRE